MTNDYISRAAVLAHIKEAQCQKCSDIWLCGNCAVLTAVRLVESVPAADVVEAVRCRDCKHYDCEDGDQKCVKDADWSEEDACYYGFIAYHGPEFFCADGERKEGEKDDG